MEASDLDELFESSKSKELMPSSHVRALIQQVRSLTVERDHLHEIYDAANADRESYAGQIDQLREQVERLTEERDDARTALGSWRRVAEDLGEQVERLTFERDSLANDIASNEGRQRD